MNDITRTGRVLLVASTGLIIGGFVIGIGIMAIGKLMEYKELRGIEATRIKT